VSEPLAIIFYENLLSGNQLANRLRDLGYGVRRARAAQEVPEEAARLQALFVFLEIGEAQEAALEAVRALKSSPRTRHVPVLAFTGEQAPAEQQKRLQAAREAGADAATEERGLLAHLPAMLEQLLNLD